MYMCACGQSLEIGNEIDKGNRSGPRQAGRCMSSCLIFSPNHVFTTKRDTGNWLLVTRTARCEEVMDITRQVSWSSSEGLAKKGGKEVFSLERT